MSVAIVGLGRFPCEAKNVITEAVDVLCEDGVDHGDDGFRYDFAPLFQHLDQPCERTQVMKDQAVGDQVVVLDGFTLVVAAILRDNAFAVEEQRPPVALSRKIRSQLAAFKAKACAVGS